MRYQPRNCLPINATVQCPTMLLISTTRTENYTYFVADLLQKHK